MTEMRSNRYTIVFWFIASLLMCCPAAFAQQTQQQPQEVEDSHAHSTRRIWKGINMESVLQYNSSSVYTSSDDTGETIFLYNVGTGRFIIEGGNWAMEGRLFHEDFGRPMHLYKNGIIRSGITEFNSSEKCIFGCNIPGVFHSQGNWNNWNQYSFTVMMDADRSKRTKINGVYQGWKFKPVPNAVEGTNTYYMYEEKNGTKYYLGAAYGYCNAQDWKGVGEFVAMDDDRACWTTGKVEGNTTTHEVNGDVITIDELYQWRVVSKDELLGALEDDGIGLNPSVSILVDDRDFTRNAENFEGSWGMYNSPNADYSTLGRYGFTYGVYENKTKQKELNSQEPWNKPMRLKNVFDNNKPVTGTDNMAYGWENSKNGFLTFEGVGSTYTTVVVPKPGWYQVQCFGFVQSENNHDAYLFAKVEGSDETSPYGGQSRINLHTVPFETYHNKNIRDSCLRVGIDLRKKGAKYTNVVWICITEDQFANGIKTLQIGIGKDEATRATGKKQGNTTYYYDSDWVCIDDFRLSYLGLKPAFFYEEEEDLTYLIPPTNGKQHLSASPNGQYAGGMCLERNMKTGQWNTFSFPIPLTGEQVRLAFGEDARLATVHSVGVMSQNPDVIDFKSVTLFTKDFVVEPGVFYLLMPTKDPIKGYDPQGRLKEYYELGRSFFSVRNPEDTEYDHFKVPTDVWKGDSIITKSQDGSNNVTTSVNYVQTPGYSTFTVSGGIYNGTADVNGIYAPKGSYAVSNNTLYHLNKDTRIKGFRGWLTLANEIGQEAKDFTMSVFGIFDKEPQSVATSAELPRIQLLSDDESVYDLMGRKVGKLGSQLPKGIYIVRGKKYFVK